MSQPSVLFVGHSHTDCIAAAAKQMGAANVGVVSLVRFSFGEALRRKRERRAGRQANAHDAKATPAPAKKIEEVRRAVKWVSKVSPIPEPDVLCLCLEGNRHNVLGLIESPRPFSVGDRDAGSVPPMEGERHFIPHRVLWDIFDDRNMRKLILRLFNAYPNAKRVYLGAPPPVDWERLPVRPWFLEGTRSTPKGLKMHLYQVQREVEKEMAEQAGAVFVEPDESLLDGGFLSTDYCADVTHGNVAYGKVMLKRVMDKAAELS